MIEHRERERCSLYIPAMVVYELSVFIENTLPVLHLFVSSRSLSLIIPDYLGVGERPRGLTKRCRTDSMISTKHIARMRSLWG